MKRKWLVFSSLHPAANRLSLPPNVEDVVAHADTASLYCFEREHTN